MKKTFIASLLATAGLVMSGAVIAQAPAKMVPLAAEAAVLTATVDSVDVKKRIVVLKDSNGNLAQMNVSKEISDLEKVKKGDVFVIEHAQAIAVGLTAATKDANSKQASPIIKLFCNCPAINLLATVFAETGDGQLRNSAIWVPLNEIG